ncbi:MAG: hypothetical protein AAGI52_00975 [Bacteroidota bacterium]
MAKADPARLGTEADGDEVPRRRLGVFRFIALALGLIVAFVFAEFGLRLIAPQPTGPVALAPDPDVGAMPRPDFRGRKQIPGVYAYTFTHAPEGLRTVPASATDSTAPEVLILGDSFTYGMGVEDGETFASRLAEGLRERGTDVRVRNASRPGGAPDFALRLLQARDWRPSVVLYAFYANDYNDLRQEPYFSRDSTGALVPLAPDFPARERLKLRLASVPGYDALRTHSHVVGLLGRLVALTGERGGITARQVDLDTLSTPLQYGLEPQASRAEDFLRRLRDEAEARGARFVAVYLPSASQVAAFRRTGQISADEATFLRTLSTLGTDGLTLSPVLAATDAPIADLYFPETHWKSSTHALAARTLLDPVQAALCVQDTRLAGCATAPLVVRQIVERRAGRASGG